MKLAAVVGFSVMMASSSLFAMGFTTETGKHFTNLDTELGKSSSGLYLQGSWLKNTKDGVQTAGAGVGYNLELGPVMFNLGTKAVYIEPRKGDNGIAFPVGGGVNISLFDGLAIYGEGYSATKSQANSVKNYVEANAGMSWQPITPVMVKVGYRHVSVDGEKGRPGHTLIDGPYAGVGLTF